VNVYEHLPHLNGSLNAATTLLLLGGFAFVKAKYITAHRACMGLAFLLSIIFLASYLTLHAKVGATSFKGEGAIRTIYYSMLVSHMILAATVPFLATRTIWLALKGRFDEHKKIARITFPIWLYVASTGVLVYLFLYRWFPSAGA
jgi:uncharacterized membrane protein YozB (DUF420 family)